MAVEDEEELSSEEVKSEHIKQCTYYLFSYGDYKVITVNIN